MTQQNIQMFMIANQKNFDQSMILSIQKELEQLNDNQLALISSADYKSPTTLLIISILIGGLGIDRFMLGETGMGVLKLFTAGCFGILTIIDWFTILNKAKQKNYEIFMQAVNFAKQNKSNSNTDKNNCNSFNIEKIKEYKALLDAGIITQEEFDEKKREVLGLFIKH